MKKLGIIGGMGPMATADLYRRVIELTPADSDQEHIETWIGSVPQIPDRTAYLLGTSCENPLPKMVEVGKSLRDQGADQVEHDGGHDDDQDETDHVEDGFLQGDILAQPFSHHGGEVEGSPGGYQDRRQVDHLLDESLGDAAYDRGYEAEQKNNVQNRHIVLVKSLEIAKFVGFKQVQN